MSELLTIKNKVVIVTGGYRGNGLGIASGLAKEGAIVYSYDLNYNEPSKFNGSFYECKGDVKSTQDFQTLCESIISEHGRIDCLINNAGITKPADNDSYPDEYWNQTIEINLTAIFQLCKVVVEIMKGQSDGSIINITSLGAEHGFPNNPAYIASKGGLKMMTKSFAYDYGKYGIRCNSIGPGYMKTDMTKGSYGNEERRELMSQHTMLGRWGTPEDLVGPCAFLISNAANYVTGQDIYIDGGWTASGLIQTT